MATVFEVRDEIREVVEPMIPPVKVPERQGRRPVVGRVCFDTEAYAKVSLKKYKPMAARNEDRNVSSGLL